MRIAHTVDDDVESLAPSVAIAPSAHVPSRFDKADLKRLRTKLQPSEVARWSEEFVETLKDYSMQAATLAAAAYDVAAASICADPTAAALDRWAARQALNCFDREAPDVKLLLDSSDACIKAARTSIVKLLPLLRTRSRVVNGEEARLRAA